MTRKNTRGQDTKEKDGNELERPKRLKKLGGDGPAGPHPVPHRKGERGSGWYILGLRVRRAGMREDEVKPGGQEFAYTTGYPLRIKG